MADEYSISLTNIRSYYTKFRPFPDFIDAYASLHCSDDETSDPRVHKALMVRLRASAMVARDTNAEWEVALVAKIVVASILGLHAVANTIVDPRSREAAIKNGIVRVSKTHPWMFQDALIYPWEGGDLAEMAEIIQSGLVTPFELDEVQSLIDASGAKFCASLICDLRRVPPYRRGTRFPSLGRRDERPTNLSAATEGLSRA